jgi:hypothetical protein
VTQDYVWGRNEGVVLVLVISISDKRKGAKLCLTKMLWQEQESKTNLRTVAHADDSVKRRGKQAVERGGLKRRENSQNTGACRITACKLCTIDHGINTASKAMRTERGGRM